MCITRYMFFGFLNYYYMKKYLILIFILFSNYCKAQMIGDITDTSHSYLSVGSYGFLYCKGIDYTTETNNSVYIHEKVKDIIIEGDTITAIRNLLTYLLEEKNENDYAKVLLSRINLPYMGKLFKDKTFDFYLKGYKIILMDNQRQRNKKYNYYKPLKKYK